MELYHSASEKIEKIRPNGRFGSWLFFGSDEDVQGLGGPEALYKIEIDSGEIAEPHLFFYSDDYDSQKLDPLVNEIMERVSVDRETAEDLLSERTSLLDIVESGLVDKFDAELDWDLQVATARAAKILGFRGVEVKDEHGISFMIDMIGRESDLQRIK